MSITHKLLGPSKTYTGGEYISMCDAIAPGDGYQVPENYLFRLNNITICNISTTTTGYANIYIVQEGSYPGANPIICNYAVQPDSSITFSFPHILLYMDQIIINTDSSFCLVFSACGEEISV